jgi:hypothetical protein
LFNWLFARHHGGKYLLRIEDTDKARSTQPAIDAILDGLDWLGIGGDGEPYFQSQFEKRHAEVAHELIERGAAYRCYLTPEELAARFEGYAFGCDICNDVCPWNQRFATATTVAEFQPRPAPDGVRPDLFEAVSDEEFAARYGDTPPGRPGLAGMRRNFRAACRSRRPVATE